MHDRAPQSPLRSSVDLLLRFAAFLLLAAPLAPVRAAGADTASPAGIEVNSTVAGELTVGTTFLSAGFEWRITGDDDDDCVVTLEYRRPGGTWQPAQPLLRVETGLWTHGEDPGNLLAGSLFYLRPGTTYEARLTLSDPDGGTAQRTVAFTTRAMAQPTGRTLVVVPGTGGGTGTQADPFRGLAAADAAARPGDLFLLQAGTYAGKLTVTKDGTATQPIVYRGASQASVVLDGGGGTSSTSNCVSLVGRKHVRIEDMSLVNCLRPVLADGSEGCAVRGCLVRPIDQLLSTRGILALGSRDLVLANNTIRMPGQWATIGRTGDYGTGGYAISISGPGAVVCHNTIVDSWDAISASNSGAPTSPMSNVDVYGNFIDRASDDGIQTDATHHNIRVFRNRMVNVGCALSFQPIFGGPGYLLHNEVFNARIEPYKFHQETSLGWTQETSGIVVAHNTTVCSRNGWYESGIWRHASFANNLILGARSGSPTLSAGYSYVGARFDHDAYNRVGASTLVSFSGGSYASLAAFFSGTGHEQHGIEVTTAALANAPYPHDPQWNAADGYGWAYTSADYDLRLAAGSAAVDKGTVLANISDGFAGAAPDIGCHEAGSTPPPYGPRTAALAAAAGADRTEGGPPLAVAFAGSASNALARAAGHRWDFGDSTATSDEQNPAHTYAKAGTYVARLTVTDEDGAVATASLTVRVTGTTAVGDEPALALEPPRCLPNPFRGSATVRFALPRAAAVRVSVYDVTGARVRTLAEGEHAAGEHAVDWDGRAQDGAPAPAGLYFLELSTGGRGLTRRVTLLR